MSETTGYEVEFYVDEAGEYRWRVTAANGETVSLPSEGYKNESDCVRMATLLHPGFPQIYEYEKGSA